MSIKLSSFDSEIYSIISQETKRQETKLEMIASENFTSDAVMEATGSTLTNKYAEGYPNKRYYGGCEVVDKVEELAIARAKQLFGSEYANVQPHCGSGANMAVYMGFLKPGDTVMGMNLAQGGHLTHGSSVSFSGKLYNIVQYGVSQETELIDYEALEKQVAQHNPKMIIAGASSYSRTIDFAKFAEIAQEHNALLMVDMAHIAGLVAAGIHPSPVPYADVVTSTTHKTLRGPRGGLILVGKDIKNKLGITTAKGLVRKYSAILNSAIFPGTQGGPLMHVIAAKAVAFKECMEQSFVEYQKQVVKNAQALATGLTEGGARIISGGTDNHLMVVDVTPLNITGKDAEEWLDLANISTNKNAIPFDPLPPAVSSGIRLGTPALTSRGMKENDMIYIADLIIKVLKSRGDSNVLHTIATEVASFTQRFDIRE